MRILDYAAGGLAQKAQVHLHRLSRDAERNILLPSGGRNQEREASARGTDNSSAHARAFVMRRGHAHPSGLLFFASNLR